jgi:hypothetical protein
LTHITFVLYSVLEIVYLHDKRRGGVNGERAAELGAVAAYLAVTLTVSYAVWGPYDGVEHDPAWADSAAFSIGLLAVHAAAGFAIGRWWAVGLPPLWALCSIPAEGYDVPVTVGIAFGSVYLWIPAVLAGLVLRWVVERGLRPS